MSKSHAERIDVTKATRLPFVARPVNARTNPDETVEDQVLILLDHEGPGALIVLDDDAPDE